MKKILLFLFFVATNMGITRLSAYCFYNYSDNKAIFVRTWAGGGPMPDYHFYFLQPGKKGCWNWKDIDKKNRAKEWFWEATIKGWPEVKARDKPIGRGRFPIGGAVYYSGWTAGKGEFDVYYKGKPWKWWEKPWKHKKQPWKSYKR